MRKGFLLLSAILLVLVVPAAEAVSPTPALADSVGAVARPAGAGRERCCLKASRTPGSGVTTDPAGPSSTGSAISETLPYTAGADPAGIDFAARARPMLSEIAALPNPADSWSRYYARTAPPEAPAQEAGIPVLFINEFMADNETFVEDPDEPGEFPDWVELYNPGTTPVDLGGFYLSDNLNKPTQYRIPAGVSVPAGGWVVFYLDGEPEQGPHHTNFKLDKKGEAIGLWGGGGSVQIDVVVFGPQRNNRAVGRYPDGGIEWQRVVPTPGSANILWRDRPKNAPQEV